VATIGLKINRDNSGLGIAEMFSKAMTSGVDDAIAVAKLKSSLATDEMQRRQLREAASLLTQQTIEQSMKNKYAHANRLAAYDAAEQASQLEAFMNGSEPPVVVGDETVAGGGGTTAPAAPAAPADPAAALAAVFGGARPEGPVSSNLPYEMPEIVADPRLAGVPQELLPQPNVPMPPTINGLPPQIALDATAPGPDFRPAMPAQPGLAGLPAPLISQPGNPATQAALAATPPELVAPPLPPMPGMPTGPAPSLDGRTRMGSPAMQDILNTGPAPTMPPAIPGLPLELNQPPMPPAIPGLPLEMNQPAMPPALGGQSPQLNPPPPPVVAGRPEIPGQQPGSLPSDPGAIAAIGKRVMDMLGIGGGPAPLAGNEPPMPPALRGLPRDLGGTGLPPGATVATPDQFIGIGDVLAKLGMPLDDGVSPVPVDMDATAATPMTTSPAGTPATSILDSIMREGVPKEIPNYSSQPPGVPPPPLQATPPGVAPPRPTVAGMPAIPPPTGLPGPKPIVNPLDDVMPLPIGEEAGVGPGQEVLGGLPPELVPPRPAPPQPASPAAPPAAASAGDAAATSSAAASPVDAAADNISAAVAGVDGGKSDTATTVQTKQGPVERAAISAMMKYIFLNADNPEQAVQAAQRWAGTVGATYNPKFGVDQKFTENAASLRQGGGALAEATVAGGTGEATALPGSASGTGDPAFVANTFIRMQDYIRRGERPPPSVVDAYAHVYAQESRPTISEWVDPQTNRKYRDEKPPALDPNLPSPAAVRAWLAGGPVPSAGSAAPAGGQGAPAASPAAAGGTAAAPATSAGGGTVVEGEVEVLPDGTRRTQLGGPEEKALTEAAADKQNYYMSTKAADKEIRTLQQADMPSMLSVTASDPTVSGGAAGASRIGTFLNALPNYIARTNNPGLKRYWGAATAFAAPILRDESGAATRTEDMGTILERYIPLSDDPPDVVAMKAVRRELAVEAQLAGFLPQATDRSVLDQVDAYVNANIEERLRIAGTRPGLTPTAVSTRSPGDQSLLDKYQ
jgi:hypothetical protein